MSFLFLKIYDFFSRRKYLLFTILFLLVAVCWFLSVRVKFSEDITDFLPKTKDVENINDVFKLIKSNDKLVIIISSQGSGSENTGRLISYADMLSEDIRKQLMPALIKDMTYRISEEQMSGTYDVLWKNLPLFLDEDDYQRLSTMIDEKKIDSVLNSNYKMLVSPAGIFMRKYIVRDPLNISSYALRKMSMSSVGNGYQVSDGYIFSKDKKNLLMFLSSANPTSESFNNTKLVDKLDDIIDNNLKNINDKSVNIQYYGAAAASVCNARQMKTDFAVTMGIAVLILLVFFGLFFKNKTTIIMLMLPVVFGGLFSFAIISLIHPDISLIAIGAGSVILGIAINYSIHFYAHYRHVSSIRQVIKDLAAPLTIGSTTTIGAFLGLLLVKSDVLRDFGLFSALCLVGAVLFTLIFLPFFIKARQEQAAEPDKPNLIDRFSSYHFERNPYIIAGVIVLTIFFFVMARKISFENDMNKLGYTSEKLKQAEQTLTNISDSSLRQVFVVSKGNDLNEALKNNEQISRKIIKLQQEKVIDQVSGVSPVLLSDSVQRQKIEKWESFWTKGRKENIKKWMLSGGRKLKFRDDSFNEFFAALDRKYSQMSSTDFDQLKSQYAGQFVHQGEKNNFVITILKINPKQRDAVIAAIPEDKHTVVVETQNLLSHFIDIINNDFNTILLISSLLVFCFLLFSYGRIELALIAFVPMLISWVWILGIMSLFDIKFNIFSIIISAFIFGLGDDYSIFIMDGLLQEYKSGVKLLNSYKTAVFLSAFTVFVGVGVLIFAKHPALRSIATLTIIGMLSVVFLSYTIAPALFKMLVYKKNKLRKFPVTFFGLLYALYGYTYFVGGCIITGVLGLTLIKILPVGKKKQRYIFHYLMMLVCRSTMFVMFFTKKRFINLSAETFKKPAVIICNHQSIIDIPLLMMFYPKIIMITNDKWFRSKIRGIIIRMSGYLPSSLGYDVISEKYAEYVASGYSIVIFPEGSRSEDHEIHRFHKGAFYLAEKMKLDILPVVMNGTGNYVAKGELMGRRSLITLKFLDRITPENTSFGTTYLERSKGLTNLYRKEFDEMLDGYRKPVFYKDTLIKNFIYKGPILEWYTRIKLKLENNYELYNNLIPMKAKILDIGCGYGYMSLILGMISKNRIIKGIDYDQEKIEVAAHCMSKPENVSFGFEDILNYGIENQDVFLLSDVLHYVNPEQQHAILSKCASQLNDGGMILVRDGNKDLSGRHGLTKLTELFSTNFGFNKTGGDKLHFLSSKLLEEIAANYNLQMSVIDDNRMSSNVLFVLKKQ
ncbi:MAG TPA: 1-acyl-sn-glycerol-3-phosphate acyltransferase [Bacteroidales bacterium]|nr:1-acyl-sn-glycerol-3-phosphate acyltransferase [Bacteroidales bacterium]